jgi:hypothetical protein
LPKKTGLVKGPEETVSRGWAAPRASFPPTFSTFFQSD